MRLFIAIELSNSIRQKLSKQIENLDSILVPSSVRWVKASGIHLTLKFLGETQDDRIEAIKNLLARTVTDFSPFIFHVGEFGCFPNKRRPRVLWVGIQEKSGVLVQLHNRIESEFRQIGFKPENRPFRGHLTLGRIKKNISSDSRKQLASQLNRIHIGDLGSQEVIEITLMRSILRPTGAEYSHQGIFKLGEMGI
jgi:2'-5' RNA ligase